MIDERAQEFIKVSQRLTLVKKNEILCRFSGLIQGLHGFTTKTAELFDTLLPQIVSLEDALEKDHSSDGAKEGQLQIKRGSGWSREFCEIVDGKFLSYRPDTKFTADKVLDLQLCAVKSFLPEREKEKGIASQCFQLITPGQKKPLVLQADTAREKKSWEDAIVAAIAVSLDNGSTKQQQKQVSITTTVSSISFPLLLLMSARMSTSSGF